ncbi:MAG: glycoside hydrolase family 2 TIM barrel-domain containing protein [Candidatus Kryptoniota bacterium]
MPYQNGMPVPTFEKQDRPIIDLRGVWKKLRFNADHNISLSARDSAGYSNLLQESNGRFLTNYDDSSWESKMIPSVENVMYPFPKVPEYYENGVWYRRQFSVPDSFRGKFVKLVFYAVNYIADVWINGNYVGYHEGGYTSFSFDVTKYLNYGGLNTIAVRVDNPPWGSRKDIVPYTVCDWFNYTGIIHDVYLEASDIVSVVRADIVPLDTVGDIQTTIIVFNEGHNSQAVNAHIDIFTASIDSTNILSEKASALVGSEASVVGDVDNLLVVGSDSVQVWKPSILVNNPKLWTPQNPNLYVMKITLRDVNGYIVDQYYTQFGIRTVRVDSCYVLLNGKTIFLTGVARHEDHPVYGRSIPDSVTYSDFLKIKALNADYIRTAHYPNSPFTYLLADRMGLAIMEEIPVWQFDDPSAFIIQNNQRHVHQQMFREMVFRDYNRPSILFWSTCNECLDQSNRAIYIKTINDDIKSNYNDFRLLTQSAAADRPGSYDPSQQFTDVAGWTMYFGIFYGASGDYSSGTTAFLDSAHSHYPNKPIIDTEFGFWSTENNSTENQQASVFYLTFAKAFAQFGAVNPDGTKNRQSGFLAGVTWWCAFDWYSAGHPAGYESMGVYSMDRKTMKRVGIYMIPSYKPYNEIGGVTGINLKNRTTTEFDANKIDVMRVYPNPFNPAATLEFYMPQRNEVTVEIYDILGRRVMSPVQNVVFERGSHQVRIDLQGYSSGVYLCIVTSGSFLSVQKILYIK